MLDFPLAAVGVFLLAPFLVAIGVLIKLTSEGPILYNAERIGRGGESFEMLKFRTMVPDADKVGPCATPEGDPRVTSIGQFLRKYKLDELPQLFNVLKGEMSLVGPRPEAEFFFEHYSDEEKETVLSVRPGMTDLASLSYFDEDAILSGSEDPVQTYLDEIRDDKVHIQMEYVDNQSLLLDLKIILATIGRIVGLDPDLFVGDELDTAMEMKA